jgi:hypothetical protein
MVGHFVRKSAKNRKTPNAQKRTKWPAIGRLGGCTFKSLDFDIKFYSTWRYAKRDARKPAKLLAETVNNKVHGISASLYRFNIYNEQRNLYASFET